MARPSRIIASGINVSAENMTPPDYLNHFERLMTSREAIKSYGDERFVFSYAKIDRDADGNPFIEGVLSRFTEIDPSGQDWFNIETAEPASDDDVKSISIPEPLRPNLRQFFFNFYPRQHTFVFEHHGEHRLAHSKALLAVTGLINQDSEVRFSISPIAAAESLTQIWEMDTIEQITISIKLPNADENSETEKAIKERLKRMNAQKLDETLKAWPKDGLAPDEETKAMANVAVKNGRVLAKGKVGSVRQEFSTDDHPKMEREDYFSEEVTDRQAFRRAALKFLDEAN